MRSLRGTVIEFVQESWRGLRPTATRESARRHASVAVMFAASSRAKIERGMSMTMKESIPTPSEFPSVRPRRTCPPSDCLERLTPSRYRERLTPFSRLPLTGKIGEIWQLAAERANGQKLVFDRPLDILPEGPRIYSYGQWAELVNRAAAALYALGVRPWDRVAIIKRNHFDIILLGCAAARIGAVPAQLAGQYDSGVAPKLLERLDQPWLITDAEHVRSCEIDRAVVDRLTTRTLSLDEVEGRPDILNAAELDLSGLPAPPTAMRHRDEPMVITHTSGTTGIPKLVLHSAGSAYSLALVEAERWPGIGFRPTDTWAMCDPYYHQRMTTGSLAIGTVTPTMIIISDPQGPDIGNLLEAHPPTVVEALPNIYLYWEALAKDPRQLFRKARLYINSFDAIHTRTIRTFLEASSERAPVWVQSWSQSEAGPIVLRPYTRTLVRAVGVYPPPTQTLGWPLPTLCRLRAVDAETGKTLPAGKPGLIQVSQPGRCLAYVGEQDRHDAKCEGDWWHTGDIGVISKLGAVRLLDREIDRIPGASGIALEDVLLDRFPTTTEVVVLAVAGGEPVPVLSTIDNEPIARDAWRDGTSDLPNMAEPIQIRWDEFPRTFTWKIRRVLLRERLLEGTHAVGVGRWT